MLTEQENAKSAARFLILSATTSAIAAKSAKEKQTVFSDTKDTEQKS
jgi:hypothetical protein